MLKLLIAIFAAFILIPIPEIKVIGALRNIMIDGNLSAHLNLDTLDKTNLYGLGPVAGLKGEIVVLDGVVYSSSKEGQTIQHQQDKTSQAAMLVYSKVSNWKKIDVQGTISDYATLEALVKQTAESQGYNTQMPFAFRIQAIPQKTSYHVIDWVAGVEHTMDNHKQFAYTGYFEDKPLELLGFYSTKHKSIFTHHTTNMHVHLLEKSSKTVGHLDAIQVDGPITIYLPEK